MSQMASNLGDNLEHNLEAWGGFLDLIDRLVNREAEDLDDRTTDDDIGSALDVLQQLVKLDLQSLQLQPRKKAETLLAKYSWLGTAAVSIASQAIATLPFGAAAATVLTCLYGRADQAAKNSKNCERLLVLVKECDKQMSKLAEAKERRLPAEAPRQIRRLGVLLVRSGHTINCYGGRHFIVRFFKSGSDMRTFQDLESGIRETMQSLTLVVAMEVMTSGSYADESKELRAAFCKAAGPEFTDDRAHEALLELHTNHPETLRKLLRLQNRFELQVIGQALGFVDKRFEKLEVEVGHLRITLEQLQEKLAALAACGPAYMAKWLLQWWEGTIGEYELEVEAIIFLEKLVAWFAQEGQEEELLKYDRHLAEQWLQAKLEVVGEHPFLRHIVLPLLDADHDNMVTRSELMKLEVMSREFAPKCCKEPPNSMPTMLAVLYTGSVGLILAQRKQMRQGIKIALDMISATLQVQDMIRTYGIASLLDDYHRGSRQWMFEKVNAWLKSALDSASEASRLFLMLADAGMGKSVFSAVVETKLMVRAVQNSNLVMVRHFFKVGQPRAQGKAAVLCLAQQLSEQLPGFAKLLLPIVEKHGNASALSMLEAFNSFLLGPLQALDKALTPGSQNHCVIIVLDALDEADDGGSGWQAVTNMIAKEFRLLPQWTKVLLTGRPQIEPAFKAWDPVWIQPEDERNTEDLRSLLRWRLEQSKCVQAQDIDAAAELLLRKSGGQFIYSKYVFEELAEKATWTLAELERLPDGLQGMFRRVMDTLCEALREEAPDLLDLLLFRLLPVLVAVREPLTVKELAWAMTSDLAEHDQAGRERVGMQVSRLVRLLAPLFPLRMVGSGDEPCVVPYHKSVLDWLDPASSDGGGETEQASMSSRALHHVHSMDTTVGHRLLGQTASELLLSTFDQALEASSKKRTCELHQLCSEEMPALLLLGGRYSLRHAVVHLCHAAAGVGNDALLAPLHKLMLHPGFWQQAFGAGFGLDVARDLMLLGPAVPEGPGRSPMNDVIRWLKGNAATLALYPRAALQFAVDAPGATMVARCADALSHRPPARLLTKDNDWPPSIATFLGHTEFVTSVAISLDGKTIVSGSNDKTVRVWDALTGQQKSVLEGHVSEVTSVAISPDCKTIVSGSVDKTVLVWDAIAGQLKGVLEGHTEAVTCVAMSRSGELIVSGSRDKTLRMWDAHTGQQKSVLKGHTLWVESVAISLDSKTIASGSRDMTVQLWDAETGQPMRVIGAHTRYVRCVAISPDGKTIAAGSDDKTVRMWDAFTGQKKSELEGDIDIVNSVAFSSDGENIVSGSYDLTVRVWDALTGQQKSMLDGHSHWVTSVAISPDGKTIVSGSSDKTVRVWDALARQQKSVHEGRNKGIGRMAISPDGASVVSQFHDKTVRVWGLEDGQVKLVLVGTDADDMAASTRAWSSARDPALRAVHGSRQVMELQASHSKQLSFMIYVTHPHQMDAPRNWKLQASSLTKRAAALTKDNVFLCYELLI